MSPSRAAPPPGTPRAIYCSMALLGLTLVTPVAISYYYGWHPMENDRGFGVGIIATGATLIVGLAAVLSALVGGRHRPRSVATRVTLGLATLLGIMMTALVVAIVLLLT